MANMDIYNQGRHVPENACKVITAGRLKGMTNIAPMWRIKKLTEIFGPCGLGWYTEKTNAYIQDGSGGEAVAVYEINLYVKIGGEWSKPIYGIGGAMYIAQERNGLHTDDEAMKKAYTDALSVACKALGIGADVYYEKDSSKYDVPETDAGSAAGALPEKEIAAVCQSCKKNITAVRYEDGRSFTVSDIVGISKSRFNGAVYCCECQRKIKQKQKEAQQNGASA